MTIQDTTMRTEAINHFLIRRTVLTAAVSVLCLGMIARTERAAAQPPAAPLVTLQVVDRETGQVARVWGHAGKLYIAGQPGARYGLRVTNNSGVRVMAVMSVDGVNIVTGETAAYDQDGYVFGPHETYDINGWRKSDNEIAAFNFAPLAGAYAAKTGRPNDVGVIGVAAFREREVAPTPASPAVVRKSQGWNGTRHAPPPPLPKMQSRPAIAYDTPSIPPLPVPPVERRIDQPTPPPLALSPVEGRVRVAEAARAEASVAPPSAKLGTGHGAREWSSVVDVDFERATTHPQYVYRLEYDSQVRLIASGVIPRPLPSPPAPSPFPGNRSSYVPDPPYDR
jgi:hypothetical protein